MESDEESFEKLEVWKRSHALSRIQRWSPISISATGLRQAYGPQAGVGMETDAHPTARRHLIKSLDR